MDDGPTAVDDQYIVTAQGWVLDVAHDAWIPLSPPDDTPDDLQAVTAGNGHAYLWGGVTWDNDDGTLSAAGWTAPLNATDLSNKQSNRRARSSAILRPWHLTSPS